MRTIKHNPKKALTRFHVALERKRNKVKAITRRFHIVVQKHGVDIFNNDGLFNNHVQAYMQFFEIYGELGAAITVRKIK